MRTLRLLLTVLAAFAAHSAFAHTELAATVPADRATLAAAPETLDLEFSEPVRLTALTVQRDGAAKQSLGPLPSGNSGKFSMPLPAGLGDGHYVVSWRAMSEDTHVISGEFMFAVGAAAAAGAHDGDAAADAHAGHAPAAAPATSTPAAPATSAPAAAAPATPASADHGAHGGAH